MFHKISSEEKEGHCHGEGYDRMLSSTTNTFPAVHMPRISFQGFYALIVKELAANDKIIISDTGVHVSTFKKNMVFIHEWHS